MKPILILVGVEVAFKQCSRVIIQHRAADDSSAYYRLPLFFLISITAAHRLSSAYILLSRRVSSREMFKVKEREEGFCLCTKESVSF